MGNRPTVSAKDAARVLRALGFECVRQKGSHQTFRHPVTKTSVVVAMHVGDLPKGTLRRIIKDAGCGEDAFFDKL